jgi:hypothetical protein
MRFSGGWAHRHANRVNRLGLLVLLAFCGAAAGAGPALASTWSGASPGPNWSDAANWSDAVPTSSVGTLSFPQLTSAQCAAGHTCYASNNNLFGLTVGQLQINAADSYIITGNPITLTGGLTTLTGSDQGGQAHLNVPITLGADQTWTLNATTPSLPDYLDLGSPLSGAHALTVNIGNLNALALNGDNEIGPVNVIGVDAVKACNNGGLDIRDGNSLNSANGNPLTLTDVSMQAEGTSIGPLRSIASCLRLDSGPVTTGPLRVANATFDSNSSIEFTVYGAGGTVGTDYAQLNSPGTINLGGARLSVSNVSGSPSCSIPPLLGTQYAFVSTTGALTGTFGNAPNGGTIHTGCPGSPDEYVIGYTSNSVIATLITAPTTALTHTPASAVTNQPVTLQATITAQGPGSTTAGTVNFEAGGVTIPGCGAVQVSAAVATCQTSFAAASSPVALSALFTQAGSVESAPVPGTDGVTVGKDSAATATAVSNAAPVIGATVTYTATVTPAHAGPTEPSGSVEFLDNGTAIGACASTALTAGSSSSTATCKLSYPSTGSHSITAKYAGDGSFTGSTSSPAKTVTVLKTVGKPSLSRASLRGIAKGHDKLVFTATAGKGAPALKTIAIAPTSGITCSSKKGIVVKDAKGKLVKFTAKVSHGALTITLKAAASKVQITVVKPSIAVGRRLARRVATKKVKSVTFSVNVTDAGHKSTKLTLKVKKVS